MQVDECIFWLSIIFITILCTPQPTIVRWSSTPPVSDEVRLQWKGFCALIANAYFMKGMAWWDHPYIFFFLFFPFLYASSSMFYSQSTRIIVVATCHHFECLQLITGWSLFSYLPVVHSLKFTSNKSLLELHIAAYHVFIEGFP